ncbi:MAG: hypothetical protein U0353_12760 [Sandaracinus sp.]
MRKWSTIKILKRTYSVPSRLIGHEVEVRLFADILELRYAGKLVETIPRLRGQDMHCVDYRHVIWSLARKPGAFAQYRYRGSCSPRSPSDAPTTRCAIAEVIAPTSSTCACSIWRRAQARCSSSGPSTAARERPPRWDHVSVKELAHPETPTIPVVHVGEPDLGAYDELLTAVAS